MEAPTDGDSHRAGRLKSWKEIAAFFGTDERTVRRWATGRGMPVNRIPGGARSTVYAEIAELERWMSGPKEGAKVAGAHPPVGSAATRSGRAPLFALLALLLAGSALAALAGRDVLSGAKETRHQPSQRALDLHLAATYQWERRTPASLGRATALFGQAIAEDPAFAEAYTGLANTYLLMREYGGMADSEAYPRAQAAAERALHLDDRLSDAHAAHAFVTFYWTWDLDRGLREFQRAIALDPRSARARHWYATALLHAAAFEKALEEIEAAQQLDPTSHAILADKGLMLLTMGRREEGVALLRQVAAAEPGFLSPHVYMARFYLVDGNYRAFLSEARIAARLSGDEARLAVLDEAERALQAGGGKALLRTLLADQKRLSEHGRVGSYALANMYALIGDRDAALRHIEAAARAREPAVLGLLADPMLAGVRNEPAFRRLARRIGMPPPAARADRAAVIGYGP